MATMESGQPVGDGIDQSQFSQPEGDQQSSPGGVGLEIALQQLEARIDAKIRGLQSANDKNKAATSREVGQLKEQFTRMKGYLDRYPDPDEAARQMAIDDLIGGTPQAQFTQVPATPPQVSGGQPATPGIDAELLALLGVGPSDPHFVAEMASGKSAMEAAKAVARAKQQAAPPSPAGIMPTGGSAPATTQKAALQAAYDKEVAQVRRGDWSGIEALKAKYRSKGLTDLW